MSTNAYMAQVQAEQARTEAALHRRVAERVQWQASDWEDLPVAAQIALSVAYAVEATDPKLSAALADLAKYAREAHGQLPCPQRQWWLDLKR